MNECLQLYLALQGVPDGADLGELQFPRQYQPPRTQRGVCPCGCRAYDARLRGDVNLHVGQHFFDGCQYAEIGNDYGIQPTAAQLVQEAAQGRVLVRARHGVEGQVYLAPHTVCQLHGIVQFRDREVSCLRAHSEALPGKVYGVCAEQEGGFEFFRISGGG